MCLQTMMFQNRKWSNWSFFSNIIFQQKSKSVSNRNTKARCETSSKWAVTTSERHQWHRSIFLLNLKTVHALLYYVFRWFWIFICFRSSRNKYYFLKNLDNQFPTRKASVVNYDVLKIVYPLLSTHWFLMDAQRSVRHN